MAISASNWAAELIKKQKNPHGQLIWVESPFQPSIYHSSPLKPGCVKKIKHLDFKKSSANVWKSDVNLGLTFNKAPIKTSPFQLFLCQVDPYLVRIL